MSKKEEIKQRIRERLAVERIVDSPADGLRFADFQRAMQRPDFDVTSLPDNVRGYLIRLEIKLYMLWLIGYMPQSSNDEDIPF